MRFLFPNMGPAQVTRSSMSKPSKMAEYLAGVINLYWPNGRRRKWSRALVRHVADPGVALVEALGVAASIFVSGTARSRRTTDGS